jgi:hypothetical protein
LTTAFGYQLTTDLTIFRVVVRSPLNIAYGASEWFEAAAFSLSEALVLGASRALGIDNNELAGNFRTVPPFPGDDSSIRGYIDFFLYDTTPGGAGFAEQAFNSYEEVLAQTGNVLKDCVCGQSCHSCLRTYQNRISHNRLDRHLAASLLDYLTTRSLPIVNSQQFSSFSRRLQLTLELMNPNLRIEIPEDGRTMRVSIGEGSIIVRFRSCLLEPVDSNQDEVVITDYDALFDIPSVAHRIRDSIAVE